MRPNYSNILTHRFIVGIVVIMEKNSSHSLIFIGLSIITLVTIAVLVLNVYTLRRVVYLDRFFTTVSEDYRAIRNTVGEPQGAIAENGNGNDSGGGAGGRVCVSSDLDLDSDPFIGDPNAPVVIVEYSDFECPFCSRYFSDSYGIIKERYIDTGLARLYFKDFPLDNIHPLARPTAITANCLYDQKGSAAFFAFHDRLFELGGRLISTDYIRQLAIEGGADAAALEACASNPEYSAEIDADIAEGSTVGVTGTPSFVINGEVVIGAVPFVEFERVIEDALAGNGCQPAG